MKFGRRQALILAGAAAVATGIGVWRTHGYHLPAGAPQTLVTLSVAEYCIVHALAERICHADGPDAPKPNDVGVAAFVDAYVASMDEPMKSDFLHFLAYIEQLAPVAVGHRTRFTALDGVTQDAVLRALETSRVGLLRGGFQGLKALLFMGYYRDPRTWKLLAYDGPWVGRPAPGFNDEGVKPVAVPQ